MRKIFAVDYHNISAVAGFWGEKIFHKLQILIHL